MDKTILKPHLLSLGAILIFSTIEVVGKMIGSNISPYAITAWRFLFGGLILIPFAIVEMQSKKLHILPGELLRFGLAGILNVCISMLLLQLSVYFGKASLSAVIISTNPLFVALFALLFLKESISGLHIIGLFVGMAGLFLIIYGAKAELVQSHNLVLGVLLGLGAALTFALYTVYSKQLILAYGNVITLCFTFLIGSIALIVLSILTGRELLFEPNWRNLLFMGYLSMFVTWLAYIMYFAAIKQIGAAKASMYFFLKPAVAGILAWLILYEHINLAQFLGILLIMISLSKQYFTKLFNPNLLAQN